MAEHHRLHKALADTSSSPKATRSSRSSTLPSQQASTPKHRHKHHHTTLHKSHHGHRASTDATPRTTHASHSNPLTPLGELLSPVKRNVADGFSGVTGWIDREKEKDRMRPGSKIELVEGKAMAPIVTLTQVEQARKKLQNIERVVEEQYNDIAAQTLEQHTALAASRTSMLRMFSRLDSTLASLSTLKTETETLLNSLTKDSIPELTEESTTQLDTFRGMVKDMETNRIGALQKRVDTAKQTTTALGERMKHIRSQIQVWENREQEEIRKRRRKVGFVWGTIGTFVLLVFLLLIWGRVNEQLEARDSQHQNWTQVVLEKEKTRADNETILAVEELLRDLEEDNRKRRRPPEPMPWEQAESEPEDNQLSSIFDEL